MDSCFLSDKASLHYFLFDPHNTCTTSCLNYCSAAAAVIAERLAGGACTAMFVQCELVNHVTRYKYLHSGFCILMDNKPQKIWGSPVQERAQGNRLFFHSYPVVQTLWMKDRMSSSSPQWRAVLLLLAAGLAALGLDVGEVTAAEQVESVTEASSQAITKTNCFCTDNRQTKVPF